MAAPVAPMTWEQMYAMVTAGLRGTTVDPTLFTEMLNEARMNREVEHPYLVLQTQDKSQTWNPSDTWQTAKPLPANFVSFIEDIPMQLWDGSANPGSLMEPVNLTDIKNLLWYNTNTYTAGMDYFNNQFFMAGTINQPLIIVQNYIADTGDILPMSGQTSYTWNNIPPRYHKMLPYDVLCMFRLGVSYDDLAARNADNNGQRAEMIANSMRRWDSRLRRTNLRNTDYFPPGTNTYRSGRIDVNQGR